MKRLTLIVTLALAMDLSGLVRAVPAHAQAERERNPLSATPVNPCTGEVVAVEGFIQFVENVNGIHAVVHVSGVSVTGRKYVGQDNARFGPDGSGVVRSRLISQGSTGDDNFTTIITFPASGPPTFMTECRG